MQRNSQPGKSILKSLPVQRRKKGSGGGKGTRECRGTATGPAHQDEIRRKTLAGGGSVSMQEFSRKNCL